MKLALRLVSALLFVTGALFAFSEAPIPLNAHKVFAAGKDNPKVIYQAKEIKNHGKLMYRAKHGISDLPKGLKKKLIHAKQAVLKGNSTSKSLKSLHTSQLLKKAKHNDGSISKTYAVTSITPISTKDLAATTSYPHNYLRGYDRTASVRAYSTYYYTVIDNEYKLIKATGGWDLSGSTRITVSNETVYLKAHGLSRVGRDGVQTKTIHPGLNFSSPAPDNWAPVAYNNLQFLGTTQRATISRGGDSWTFTFNNCLNPDYSGNPYCKYNFCV